MSITELRQQIAAATESWCKSSSPDDLARLHVLRVQYQKMLGASDRSARGLR
ncbi:MAG: hypothetical protein NVSMB52_20010 [Chloroflexota bacterium]